MSQLWESLKSFWEGQSSTNKGAIAAGAVVLSAALAYATSPKLRLEWNFLKSSFSMALRLTSRESELMKYVFSNAKEGDPESVLNAIDEFCGKTWMMNVGNVKGKILDDVVSETKPMVAVELGAYCGYSAVRIARLLPSGAKLYSIEPSPLHCAVVKSIVAYAGLSDKVEVVRNTAAGALPTLKDKFKLQHVDFVFIDHVKTLYKNDTKVLEDSGLLRKGSVLLADNVLFPGAPDFLEYVRTNPKYKTQFFKSHLEYNPGIVDGLEKCEYQG